MPPHVALIRIFVWQLSVRIFHWLNVVCILVLAITGLLIGEPPALQSASEPWQQFWFGTVRFLHFAAGYVLVFNFIFRVYIMFNGNKWARWDQFIPTTRERLGEIFRVIKVDILLMKGKEKLAIGHNSLAGLTYFILFLFLLLSVFTGFGLYADGATWWFPRMFAWVPALFGEEFILRQVHHILTWVFIVFTLIHVYLSFFHDFFEGRGELSSIVGGFKFVERDVYEEEKQSIMEAEQDANVM